MAGNDTAALERRGWDLFEHKQYDQAIKVFNEVLDKDPKNVAAFQCKIASLRSKDDFLAAEQVLREALKILPSQPGILSESGWINFEQGRYEEAERDFSKVADLLPSDACSQVNLAWCLVRQGTDAALEKATEHCQRALELDGNLAQAFGCLGNIAFKRGHIGEAETCFLKSIEVNPDKGHYADLGALYVHMGRYEEAEGKLKEALSRNHDDAYAYFEIGNAYLQTSKVKEAISQFRLCTELNPRNPEYFKALAVGLIKAHELTDAEAVLRDGIRRCDKSAGWELHLELCRLLTLVGDDAEDYNSYQEALQQATDAIHLMSKRPEPYFYAGVVQCKLQDYGRALKNFRRALKQDEHYVQAEVHERRVRSVMRSARWPASVVASVFLSVVVLAQLVAIWILRLTGGITETTLTVLVPILLGLTVVAVLLPSLDRLKMTGFEAELREPTPRGPLTSGPRGESWALPAMLGGCNVR